MNTFIVDSFLYTLQKAKILLSEIDDESYCCNEVGPYYSSVGSHLRHVLDFYNCIFNGFDRKYVNLTARERDQKVENNCSEALVCIDSISEKLKTLRFVDLNTLIKVEDNLGKGSITLQYTLGALLAQANAHTIHHYAIIGYILDQLGIEIKDAEFGYNPTTPNSVRKATS